MRYNLPEHGGNVFAVVDFWKINLQEIRDDIACKQTCSADDLVHHNV